MHRLLSAVLELNFGKGYISKLGKSTPNAAKIQQIAERLGVSVDFLISDKAGGPEPGYYFNDEAAQEIFENRELRMLFDAVRDADPEDLKALHSMALALKRKERGDSDNTGC